MVAAGLPRRGSAARSAAGADAVAHFAHTWREAICARVHLVLRHEQSLTAPVVNVRGGVVEACSANGAAARALQQSLHRGAAALPAARLQLRVHLGPCAAPLRAQQRNGGGERKGVHAARGARRGA